MSSHRFPLTYCGFVAWLLVFLVLTCGCTSSVPDSSLTCSQSSLSAPGPARGITNPAGTYQPSNSCPDPFPYVYYLQITTGPGAVGNCVGTAISESTLITAGHCITEMVGTQRKKRSARNIEAFNYEALRKVFDEPGKPIPSNLTYTKGLHIEGELNDGKNPSVDDIALIIFEDVIVNGKRRHPFAEMKVPSLSCQAPSVGEDITLVGFIPKENPIKKWGLTSVVALLNGMIEISEQPSHTEPGDSGGPIFTVESGETRLVGVVSGAYSSTNQFLNGNFNSPAIREKMRNIFEAARRMDPTLTSEFPCRIGQTIAAFRPGQTGAPLDGPPPLGAWVGVTAASDMPGSCVRWKINSDPDRLCCHSSESPTYDLGACGPVPVNARDKVKLTVLSPTPTKNLIDQNVTGSSWN